ncbi:MAG: hypothetical protein HYZ79_04715 [Candidatus Melainabacteria bacterium]|nr:hypothetical protein [Candidatus Melainabacteria bacterium]
MIRIANLARFINLILSILILVSFSLPYDATAKGKNRQEVEVGDLISESKAAKDCEFLFILSKSTINKHSLPNLQFVASVDLPSDTKGEGIDIAGQCGDPQETILVLAKRKGHGSGEVLLSYNKDLQLVGEISFADDDEEEDEDDEEDDDDEDDDNDRDDD